jgi:Helicase conserved C-terminal domain
MDDSAPNLAGAPDTISEGPMRSARSRIFDSLRRELMGPYEGPNERFSGEFPTSRYIVGRLAPINQRISGEEDDRLGAGEEEEETGDVDEQLPLVLGFHPSSIGLSFILDEPCKSLDVRVTWGDYRREGDVEDTGETDRRPHPSEDQRDVVGAEANSERAPRSGSAWQRYPRETLVRQIPVPKPGRLRQIPLSQAQVPAGIIVDGFEDPNIVLEGVVHQVGLQRAVSLFIVNRRQKLELSNRLKDERWMLQVRFEIVSSDGTAVFISRPQDKGAQSFDSEAQSYELLYREAREFSSGHGVAADWELAEDRTRASRIWSEFIPARELPSLTAPSDIAGTAVLDMKSLAETGTSEAAVAALNPLVDQYSDWIRQQLESLSYTPFVNDVALKTVAEEHLHRCEISAHRMRVSLEIILRDKEVFEAFRFANRAMWDQRIHSLWAQENRKRGQVAGSASDFDTPGNRTWRPFQMGFILQCLSGIADPDGEGANDRKIADLLWFPTAGGKTEAYLGLSAFTLGLRRLRRRNNDDGGAGVAILMRYTLRLLTVQQFQRASALISSCELIRRSYPQVWGSEPFRIGLWVGRNTTPNSHTGNGGALDALTRLSQRQRPRAGSPVQLFSCPRCGETLASERDGTPLSNSYRSDDDARRIIISCRNPTCELTEQSSPGVGIPAVVVDEEIYRLCPSLVIATVDKFAQLAYNGRTQMLFGRRNRLSAAYGHLGEAHGEKVEGRQIKDASPAEPLLPPDLLIQDELHLISGPLGTLVGLYETAVAALCDRRGQSGLIPAKIIASTATIRRAPQQMRRLYNHDVAVFPPSGVIAGDSFFAKEQEIQVSNDRTAGRLYVGVNAPGTSQKTLLVRTYAILLAAAQAEIDARPDIADPYATLVGYFSSLRALGGAKRLVEDDVRNVRLKFISNRRALPQRRIHEHAHELTSRKKSWEIPSLLKLLERSFPRGKGNYPVDVLLATNMISVGVDIDRLGLMVVAGQPKTTSEYIQATSRVGRASPGLVVTMYNWLGIRDLSHYERFRSYHEALYRFVEAISVTPYSSRAIDRGLHGVLVSMARLGMTGLAPEVAAQRFDAASAEFTNLLDKIQLRAQAVLESSKQGEAVRKIAEMHGDTWSRWAADPLRYRWLNDTQAPPQNARVLLRASGTPASKRGLWEAPTSLREVERTAAFYLHKATPDDASQS